MKLLLTADIHLTNSLPHSKMMAYGLTDRFQDQLNVLDQIYKYAEEHNAPIVVIGDLFDKRLVDAMTITHVVEAISRHPTPLYIIPGNHDAIDPVRGEFYMTEVFKALGHNNLCVFDSVSTIHLFGCNHHFVPFGSVENNREEIRQLPKSKNDILYFHNNVVGAKVGSWMCEVGLGTEELSGFGKVFAGHFHKSQPIGDNGMYVGSPMQLHYGEEGNECGCWLVEFDDGCVKSVKKLAIDSPTFHTCVFSFDEFKNESFKISIGDKIKQEVDAENYYHVIVEATYPDWLLIQPEMKAWMNLNMNFGNKLRLSHKPLYHHKNRIETSDEASKRIPIRQLIAKYPTLSSVVTGDLDVNKLKKIGLEALHAVKDGTE